MRRDVAFDVLCVLCGEKGFSMAVDFRLYLITDRKVATKPLPEAVRLALEGGVRCVQLREKDLPVRELLSLAQELRSITREFGAKLFINDRVDVAEAVEADGVHLGTRSIPVGAARKIVGTSMMIGVSTHDLAEAKAADAGGADFITYGPIFETPSKAKKVLPVGIEAIKGIKNGIAIPIFALGGVKSGSIGQMFAAGAYGISMISAILGADDIKKAAETVVQEIAGAGRGTP
jgi:thiamine-phosphate pyrophosphorylase